MIDQVILTFLFSLSLKKKVKNQRNLPPLPDFL